MKKKLIIVALALLIAAFVAGRFSARQASESLAHDEAGVTEWTCSMHPQIRQPNPGKCPICAMDLIPVASDGGADSGPRELTLSPTAQKLAEIETALVERRAVSRELRFVGKVAPDETRIREISLLADGRIEILHANYEGMPVREGDPLAEIYSPDILTAARELVIAKNVPALLQAARRKLILLGMSEQEIERVLKEGAARESFTLYSPTAGVVTALRARERGWVDRGMAVVELTDLSTVWAVLDAYESDIEFVELGQAVELTVEALPGRRFEATVAFVPPVLNDMTRSVKVRLDVPNLDGLLRPGMFVRARLAAPLKLAEGETPPLVIPATAPLITGRRAVVYVAVPDKAGTYEGREIELGPRAGDAYVVLSGLHEGEEVVVSGNMKLDSELQLLARPSMMNPEGNGAPTAHQHGEQKQTKCPVMGGAINRDVYTDHDGYRIYFCCAGCDGEFHKDPERYLSEMRQAGVTIERTPEGESHEHQ